MTHSLTVSNTLYAGTKKILKFEAVTVVFILMSSGF